MSVISSHLLAPQFVYPSTGVGSGCKPSHDLDLNDITRSQRQILKTVDSPLRRRRWKPVRSEMTGVGDSGWVKTDITEQIQEEHKNS